MNRIVGELVHLKAFLVDVREVRVEAMLLRSHKWLAQVLCGHTSTSSRMQISL